MRSNSCNIPLARESQDHEATCIQVGPVNIFDEAPPTCQNELEGFDKSPACSQLSAGLKKACNQSSWSNFGGARRGSAQAHPLRIDRTHQGCVLVCQTARIYSLSSPSSLALLLLHAGTSQLLLYQHKARYILGDSHWVFIKGHGCGIEGWRIRGTPEKGISMTICGGTPPCHIKDQGTRQQAWNLVKRKTLIA